MKMGIGVIGLGVGEAHAVEIERNWPGAVAMVVDFDVAKAKALRERFPHIKVAESAQEILEDPAVNLVSIASYDKYHAEQTLAALAHGKHVFVEKPLCNTREEALKIRAAVSRHPELKISSNLILRRYPRFEKLKQLVETGALGEIYYLEGDYNYGRKEKITNGWRGKQDFYSVVLGGGVHLIDLLLWVSGKKVDAVVAFGNSIATQRAGFRFDDCVAALLKFQGGAVAKVTCNFGCIFPHFHPVSVYGTEGTYVHRREGIELYGSREQTAKPDLLDLPYPGVQKGSLLVDFIRSIDGTSQQSGSVSQPITEDLFRAISVCFAINDSVFDGKTVQVQYI